MSLWILLAIVGLSIGLYSSKRRRDDRLDRIRGGWAKPVDHPRRFDALLESHRSRVAVTPGGRSLDDRTWADMNLTTS